MRNLRFGHGPYGHGRRQRLGRCWHEESSPESTKNVTNSPDGWNLGRRGLPKTQIQLASCPVRGFRDGNERNSIEIDAVPHSFTGQFRIRLKRVAFDCLCMSHLARVTQESNIVALICLFVAEFGAKPVWFTSSHNMLQPTVQKDIRRLWWAIAKAACLVRGTLLRFLALCWFCLFGLVLMLLQSIEFM